MKKTLATIASILTLTLYAATAHAQQSATQTASDAKTTPAYAMLILKKVEAQTELERMTTMLTSTHPSHILKQFELVVIEREMKRMAAITGERVSKLTDAYGTLLLRKIALENELQIMLSTLKPQHPEVGIKKNEIANLENEIGKITR